MTKRAAEYAIADKIKKYLEKSKKPYLDLGDIPPVQVEAALDVIGGKLDMDTLDTNGWQWDWWCDATLNNEALTISGSGWFGGTRLSRKEEDE